MESNPSSRSHIRLVVRIEENNCRTCRVDANRGLKSVLQQISSRVAFNVTGLSHVIFKAGIEVGTSQIDSIDVLEDFDIVVPHRSKVSVSAKALASQPKCNTRLTKTATSVVTPRQDSATRRDPMRKVKVSEREHQPTVKNDNKSGEELNFQSRFIDKPPPSQKQKADCPTTGGSVTDANLYRKCEVCKPMLSDEQRSKLNSSQFDLKQFEFYLTSVERQARRTRENILKKAKKLICGEEIVFKHWSSGFVADPILSMSADFDQLLRKAIVHENRHGKDASGSAVRKSIKALQKYQAYLYCKSISSLPPKYWKRQEIITDRQRRQLDGKELDPAEFKEYLADQKGIKEKNAMEMFREVIKLKNGHGITRDDWPYGVVFHPYPIAGLNINFCQILHEAETHEGVYGKHDRQGYCLTSLISNLMEYQSYCYHQQCVSPKAEEPRSAKCSPESGDPTAEIRKSHEANKYTEPLLASFIDI